MGVMNVWTERRDGLGVKEASVEVLSLMESEEASFERERFFMMSLKKLREPFPLRESAMDISETEAT